jgi:cyclase
MSHRLGLKKNRRYFDLEPLADGVCAAIGRRNACAMSNAGIIDLGGRTLVFDTFASPQAGEELREAAIEVTGRIPDWVVISHAHSDHWLGSQSFPEATVLSTAAARRHMPGMASYVSSYKQDPGRLRADIAAERRKLELEEDPTKRPGLSWSIARLECLAESLATLELRFPNLTFGRMLSLWGSRRAVNLVACGHAHSPGDVELLLPEEEILFAGDLGFFGTQPFMGTSNPSRWAAWLEKTVASDCQVVVPGHGPVGTKTDLVLEQEYIKALTRIVDRGIARGGTVEDALRERLPEPFDVWQHVEMGRFEVNTRRLFARRKG